MDNWQPLPRQITIFQAIFGNSIYIHNQKMYIYHLLTKTEKMPKVAIGYNHFQEAL
ncbi:hypothetical protein [Caudoviricetes sp.]|nr:hypothetical protein [Caudoviricetes sp.]